MGKVIKLNESDIQRIVKRVLTEQQNLLNDCKKLKDREIVVVYSNNRFIGPDDIVGTYTLKEGFVPKIFNRKRVSGEMGLKMELEDEGYLKDLVKSKDKPKWGMYVFKDELKNSNTRLSDITSSEEIERMIDMCKKPKPTPKKEKEWRFYNNTPDPKTMDDKMDDAERERLDKEDEEFYKELDRKDRETQMG